VLHPDVTLRADQVICAAAAPAGVLGAKAVAGTFAGRAHAARLALIDGHPGAMWNVGGQPRGVFRFTIRYRSRFLQWDPGVRRRRL